MTMRDKAQQYLEALGGAENIVDIEGCITRLRGTVKDPSKVDATRLQRIGAVGRPMISGKAIQVVVGTYAEMIGTEMNKLLKEKQ